MDNDKTSIAGIIGRGLASYSDAEPPAGLERRIINRIRAAETKRRRLMFWGAVLAAAASFAIAIAVWQPRERVLTPPPPPAFRASAAPGRVEVSAPKRRVIRRRSLPKEPVFPGRAPMTAEERALVMLARHNPELLVRDDGKELEIAPIQIPPLEEGGSQ